MRRPILEAKFYETYYFVGAIQGILRDQFAYLRDLDGFFGDDNFLRFARPFPKYSALHSFVEYIIRQFLADVDGIDLKGRQRTVLDFASIPEALSPHPSCLPLNEALNYYGIFHTSFPDWLAARSINFADATDDDVYDYYGDLQLEQSHEDLLDKVVGEAFHVLFQNRNLLLIFNEMMARQMVQCDLGSASREFGVLFAAPGVLKRVSIPRWVERAVIFRDQGTCVLCRRDLSGCLSIENIANFDHIVPLGQGGLNDVTNIQLLCSQCNSRKGDREAKTSDLYQTWYTMKDPAKRRR